MALNVFISSAAGPRGSIVASRENPVAQPFRDLVLGDVHAANIYLVDGEGGFDARSGAAGTSVKTSIGLPGEAAVLVNSSWTIITNGWAGQIAANNEDLEDMFDGSDLIQPQLKITITDATGNPISFVASPIRIWLGTNDTDMVSTNPFTGAWDGEYAIPDAAEIGSVTGLALPIIPRRVILSIRTPAGGLNLFPNVIAGTISTDGFQFKLNGQTDSGNYKLDYVLIP